jgi:transcriptional regulator with XRE-family HTH domain
VWYNFLHLRFLQSIDCLRLFATLSIGNIHCDPSKISGHFPADLHKLPFLTKHPFHMAHTNSNPKIHEGRNLKRFRELFNYKQDALAFELGEDWNQQKISLLEQKEKIDNDILEQVAAILKIPAEAIRNFDEQQAITVISSTFNDNSQLSTLINNYNNPIDAVLKLHEEKMALYERMLKEKDEMMERLERLIVR